jgi:hypothetical protein
MSKPLVSVDVDVSALQRSINRMALEVGKSMPSLLKQNGRLLAWNLAFNTRTARMFGLTKAVQKAMDDKVTKAISATFISSKKVYQEIAQIEKKAANGFAKLIKRGEYEKAKDIIDEMVPKYKGIDLGPMPQGLEGNSRDRHDTFIVTEQKPLKEYIAKRLKMVGWGKAGWISAGSQLGNVSKVPAWVTRHKGKSPGNAQDDSNAPNPSVSLTNSVNYINAIITDGNIKHALAIQMQKMQKHLEHVLMHGGKAAGFSMTPTVPSEDPANASN